MAPKADIGGKRLIGLAPDAWVRWATQRPHASDCRVVASDFQWVGRESDVIVRARTEQDGEFLVLTELQIRYTPQMPRRMRAYAALAEERYELPVFPLLVNILPFGGNAVAERYQSEFMGLVARQDYRVVNLWEVDAGPVLRGELPPLLPFVPVLKDGGSDEAVRRALVALRQHEELSELEPLLAFFASFVLNSEAVREIMRWDMAVLRESPWYQEILKEGMQQGLQQGIERGIERGIQQGLREGELRQLVVVLTKRFGQLPQRLRSSLERLGTEQLEALMDVALSATTLDEFAGAVPDGGEDPA